MTENISDDEIIFNKLSFNAVEKGSDDIITVNVDVYTDLLASKFTKDRDVLYDKIDNILFGLKENEFLIYLPNNANVIAVKKSECSRYTVEYVDYFTEKKKYEHVNLLEILCEYPDIKNPSGAVKTEWITLTEYTGSKFQKKTVIIEGI